MTTNWHPTGNKIMVLMDKAETVSPGGIVLHRETTNRDEMSQMEGTVVEMGPRAYDDQGTAWIKVGDRVKIQKFAGWLHEEGGDKYRVVHDLDVIMVMSKE